MIQNTTIIIISLLYPYLTFSLILLLEEKLALFKSLEFLRKFKYKSTFTEEDALQMGAEVSRKAAASLRNN